MQSSNKPSPPLPAMFERYRFDVAETLQKSISDLHIKEIPNVLQYHLGWVDRYGNVSQTASSQGKALRPTLCMFSCDALGGDIARAVLGAAALELIHNFSLIHDDIQDQDVERRHQSTVWSIWGIPKALVAGDAMQAVGDITALMGMEKGVPVNVVLRVSEILTESYLEMIEGQCLDLRFETRTDISSDDYLGMVARKTGALLRSSVHIGALIATDDEHITQAFSEFGDHIGRAFQIRDDYLGIWGDAAETGKSNDNDIRRRKKSFPVVYGFEHASGTAKNELISIYNQEIDDEGDVAKVMAILEDVGAPQYSGEITEKSAELALSAIAGVDLPNWANQEIEGLVNFLVNRQY